MQPKVYIACSSGKPGAVFALFYCESGHDIIGWHLETKEPYFSAAFFMIENFYANSVPRFYRSVEDDVYGPWTIDYPPARCDLRCPLPEAAAHELERLQSVFVEEWLFFRGDSGIDAELEVCRAHNLPINEVNVRPRRLLRMRKEDGGWRHMTPGLDPNVVQLLRKYWRLNEKVPAG
ncbi:MAG TPA: hypothetical protein VEC01_03720 [Noviherbaspirillum sp.]|uniref:hypothetical protein n=1 Tax=Noviherbaspirillum sp. TaxID=1926288 RepID=UPI002D49148F|nr:hypothetical protein [Noviherbaspirillum sp.]HYD94410.1 hypothetical protein [Noviherbaspirillum sp.]